MKRSKRLQLKVKRMILFRILALVIAVYAITLYRFNWGVGMLPIWLGVFIVSVSLSFDPIYSFIMSHKLLRFGLIFGIGFLIIVELIIFYSGVKTSIDEDSDYIIILGASVKGETPSLTLRRRIEKAQEYLELHPDVEAILSGGQGPGETITEAEAMRRFLVNAGISEDRLHLEDKSTSTMENIKYSYNIIDKISVADQPKVIVISSRFHLLRSQIIARKQGYRVKAIGSTTLVFLVPNYYFREFFGIFYEIVR